MKKNLEKLERFDFKKEKCIIFSLLFLSLLSYFAFFMFFQFLSLSSLLSLYVCLRLIWSGHELNFSALMKSSVVGSILAFSTPLNSTVGLFQK